MGAGLKVISPWSWSVVGLVLLAFLLRLGPTGQSMFGDELFLYEVVHGHSLGGVLSLVHDSEKTPPLGFVLAWLFEHGSSSDVLVRIPSLVAGLAVIPLVYLLAARTVGRWAGLFASGWITLSSFQIFYSSESRGYALVQCLVVASTLLLLVALEKRKARWWTLFALVVVAAAYTHYIAVLILGPQLIWALWTHRDQARSIALAHGAAALAYLPWVPGLIEQVRNSASEAQALDKAAPTTLGHIGSIAAKSIGGHPFVELREFPGTAVVALMFAVMAGAAIYQLVAASRRAGRFPRPLLIVPTGLLIILALAPLVGQTLYSLRPDTSFLLPRNVIVGVPYLLILAGAILTSLRPRAAAAALCAVALGAVGVGTVDAHRDTYQRTDTRWAGEVIDRIASPETAVINGQILYADIPPGQAVLYYGRKPHRWYGASEVGQAWKRAAAANAPVIVAGPSAPLALKFVDIPPLYRTRYKRVSRQSRPGLGTGITVRLWRPRR